MREVKQVIVVRKDLNMRKGKVAAQVAHAAMKFIVDNNESDSPNGLTVDLTDDEAQWLFGGSFTKVVAAAKSEDELRELIRHAEVLGIGVYPIIDSGKTEFNGVATLTCASFGPGQVDDIDRITGHLPLL